jgi:hypothetical protein
MAGVTATMMSVICYVILAIFLSLLDLMVQFIGLMERILSHICTVDQHFYFLLTFCNPGQHSSDIACFCHSIGGRVVETDCLQRRCRPSSWCERKIFPVTSVRLVCQPTYLILGSGLSESAVRRYYKIKDWFCFHPVACSNFSQLAIFFYFHQYGRCIIFFLITILLLLLAFFWSFIITMSFLPKASVQLN